MTDYREHGAEPIEDAAVDDPPTIDEALDRHRAEYREQARTSTRTSSRQVPISDEERATIAAGGDAMLRSGECELDVEGPNSA